MPDEVNLISLVNKLNIRAGVTRLSEKEDLAPRCFNKAFRVTETRLMDLISTSSGSPSAKIRNTFTGRISVQEKQVLPVPWSLRTKTLNISED